MAKKRVDIPAIDVEKVKADPGYKKAILEMRKEPEKWSGYLQVLRESENVLTATPEGSALLDDMIGNIPLTEEQRTKLFDHSDLPQATRDLIKEDPEKYYKTTYNEYKYNPALTLEERLTMRKVLSASQAALYDKDSSPQKVLENNVALKALNWLGETFSIPVNAVAWAAVKLAGRDAKDQNILGSSAGWWDALNTLGSDSYMQEVFRKTRNNIPLTPEEEMKKQEMMKKNFWPGLLLNIFADPTIVIGAAGRAVTGIAKLTKAPKAVTTAGKLLRIIADPAEQFFEARKIAKAVKSGKAAEMVKPLAISKRIGVETMSPQFERDIIKGTMNLFDPDVAGIQKKFIVLKSAFNQSLENMRLAKLANNPSKLARAKKSLISVAKKLKGMEGRQYGRQLANLTELLPEEVAVMANEAIGDAIGKNLKSLAPEALKDDQVLNVVSKVADDTRKLTKGAKKRYEKYLKTWDESSVYDVSKYNRVFPKIGVEKVYSMEVQNALNAMNRFLDAKTPKLEVIKEAFAGIMGQFQKAGKLTEVKQMAKALAGLEEQYLLAAKLTGNKMFNAADKALDWVGEVIGRAADKTGITRVWRSMMPKTAMRGGKIVATGAKEAENAMRRAAIGAQTVVSKAAVGAARAIGSPEFKKAVDAVKASPEILSAVGEKVAKSAENLLSEMVEKPQVYKSVKEIASKSPQLAKSLEPVISTVEQVKKVQMEMLIDEVKQVGMRASPEFVNPAEKKAWDYAAKNLEEAFWENRFSSKTQFFENELRKILVRNADDIGAQVMSGNVMKDVGNVVEYLTHMMTKDAKRLYLKMNSTERGLFKRYFKDYVSNPFLRQRGFSGSIVDNNRAITEILEGVTDEFGNERTMFWHYLKEQADKAPKKDQGKIMAFADSMDEFGKELAKTGSGFFDNDIPKLLALRGSRMVRSTQEGHMLRMMKKFVDEETLGKDPSKLTDAERAAGWRTPVKLAGNDYATKISKMAFHPHVAEAIDNMWTFTSTDSGLRKFINLVMDLQGVWKSMQLNVAPSTVIRNMFGNIANMLLATNNPARLVSSVKDALNVAGGIGSYAIHTPGIARAIVTKYGNTIPLDLIYREAVERGITGTSSWVVDTGRGLARVNEPIGKAAETGITGAVAGKARRVNEFFREKMPLFSQISKWNDKLETTSKLGLFIDRIKQGDDFDTAAQVVFNVLFDYTDLTDTEKLLKAVFPFYTWTKNNLPLMIQNIAKQPVAAMFKFMNQKAVADEKRHGVVDLRYQSRFMGSSPKTRYGTSQDGRPQYVMLESLLPAFDLARIARVQSGGFGALIDEMARDVTPFLKTPLENAFNRSFIEGREIEKTPGQKTEFLGFMMSPKIKNFLDDLRPLTLLNKVIEGRRILTGEAGVKVSQEKSIGKAIISWALLSPVEYDLQLSRSIASRDAKDVLTRNMNEFSGYMNRMRSGVMRGETPAGDQAQYIQDRTKQVVLALNDAYASGMITNAERASFINRLVREYLK